MSGLSTAVWFVLNVFGWIALLALGLPRTALGAFILSLLVIFLDLIWGSFDDWNFDDDHVDMTK